MIEIRELFAPYDIPIRYSGVILDQDSETDSNEYEWSPDVFSTTSSKEHNEDQVTITKEDLSIAEQMMKLERRQEKLRIQRKEAYAKRKGNDKDREAMPQEAQTQIRYGRTMEELRDSQVGLTISLEEFEFERRQNLLKESTSSCAQICQLQNENGVNQEGICSIKDVCVDITIHLRDKHQLKNHLSVNYQMLILILLRLIRKCLRKTILKNI